jgi:hypothetical protein
MDTRVFHPHSPSDTIPRFPRQHLLQDFAYWYLAFLFLKLLDNAFRGKVDRRLGPGSKYRRTFCKVPMCFDVSKEMLNPAWPGAAVIKTLVRNASGLFIWAATACRFIRRGLFADERLRTLLKGSASLRH